MTNLRDRTLRILGVLNRKALAALFAVALGALVFTTEAGHRERPLAEASERGHVHDGWADHQAGDDGTSKMARWRRLNESVPGRAAGDDLGGPVSWQVERLADRAIPGDTLPSDVTDGAQFAAARVAGFHDDDERIPFEWESLGPTNAVYPALLNRTTADYVTSGRITALAIDPRCQPRGHGDDQGHADDNGTCTVYVGAAGGGIWRTANALSRKPHWRFISGSFATNAIGSIVLDPLDPDTLYVGTGEPNASGDSAAGLGVYRSTNGGDSWTLLPAVAIVGGQTYQNFAKNLSVSGIAIDSSHPQILYVGVALGVRGVSAVGGATIGVPGRAPVGLYQSTDGGATFTRIWDAGGLNAFWGVNAVALDPSDPGIVYAASPDNGIWRRWTADAGGAFVQVFQNQSQLDDPDRTEFAITRLTNGKTRIYAGTGSTGPFPGFTAPNLSESQVWRLDDATRPAATLIAEQNSPVPVSGGWKKLTSANIADPRFATYNYCTGQCWYDNGIYTPPGSPDTVFVIGSYQYSEAGRRSNGRAVLRSITAGEPDVNGVTFTDLTRDAATPQNGIHPDQHAMAFLPGNPNVWFEGSDGGLMRASGQYTSIADQCASRQLSPASLTACRRLLSAVPTVLTSLNFGLNTLQFQSLSINPLRPTSELQGGTQDNGTFQYEGSRVTWMQSIFGDGGQSGFDAAHPTTRFHTYFGPQLDVNFRGGDPPYWAWISDPFFPGGRQAERSAFYIPVIADPTIARAGSIFAGLQSVWRTQDNGGPRAFLEANCGELLPSVDPTATCGDWVPIGPMLATGSDTYIASVARTPGDTGTLWVATRRGKVFVSKNADGPAASVSFTRIDASSTVAPNRFVTSIYVDPTNANHAWISYSGYSAITPTRPGHVFEVTWDGLATATWTALDGGSGGPMGDLPVTALVRDDPTGDLYAATDFGVMRRPAGTEHWHLAGAEMPAVEVTALSINTSARVLYAATHGRGAYRLKLRQGRHERNTDQ